MQVLPSRINTEFLHLSSLVLKVLFIQTSAISLQELLQGTKHSECLGCCLAYFCLSSHHLSPGFTFHGIQYFLSFRGFLYLCGICTFVLSTVAAV